MLGRIISLEKAVGSTPFEGRQLNPPDRLVELFFGF